VRVRVAGGAAGAYKLSASRTSRGPEEVSGGARLISRVAHRRCDRFTLQGLEISSQVPSSSERKALKVATFVVLGYHLFVLNAADLALGFYSGALIRHNSGEEPWFGQ